MPAIVVALVRAIAVVPGPMIVAARVRAIAAETVPELVTEQVGARVIGLARAIGRVQVIVAGPATVQG